MYTVDTMLESAEAQGAAYRAMASQLIEKIGDLPPDVLLQLAQNVFDFIGSVEALVSTKGLGHPIDADEEDIQSFANILSPACLAKFLLAMPITKDGSSEGEVNKRFATEVAETIGPDWAQAWYRFIVLVTKIA